MPNSGMFGMFREKTLDEYAEEEQRKLREPPVKIMYGTPPDPTRIIRDIGNYASKSLGGPSLDPAFDALDMYGSVRTLGQGNPKVLGRPARFSGKLSAAAGAANNGLLDGLRSAISGPAPQKKAPYQPTAKEETALRGMMRELREPQRLATKRTQPMAY